MNLSEQDMEDITDMIIDSRDIEEDEDFTTVYLQGYADAEEKYRKRIKELEEERQIVGMPVRNKRDERIGIVLHQWENGSIAVLENINPRVINTHDSWDTLEIITDKVKHLKTKDDSIPVQKVKEIILKIINCKIPRATNNGYYYDYLVNQEYKEVVIKLFKELLEDK